MSAQTCKLLHKYLANLYALYAKTHNYHWNVTGATFYSTHKMLEEQYEYLTEAIDDVAERIRQLGEKVPASLGLFSEMSDIKAGDEKANCDTMLKHLAKDRQHLCDEINKAIKESEGDEGTIDLLTEQLREHDKAMWMLKSSI